MNLNKYLSDDGNVIVTNIKSRFSVRRPIVCKDGLSLSVQADDFEFSCSRDSNGKWSTVEVGFPSQIVDELMKYCANPTKPLKTVYEYVPVELVEHIIKKHGGVV